MALSSTDTKHNCLSLALVVASVVRSVAAQSAASASSASSSFFAPVSSGLATPLPQKIGGANNTRCCLQALQDWENGASDIYVQSSQTPLFNFTSANQLALSGEQFPCGATYQGTAAGAPEVYITYDWCTANCGGWERSTNAVLTQWIQPFVGFILPAAVFCLNVPRKMVIDIADELFPNVSEELFADWHHFSTSIRKDKPGDWFILIVDLCVGIGLGVGKLIVRLAIASSLGLANVVVWVLIVFATAAPMILSGLYEATIDRQVLRAIEREVRAFKEKNKPRDRNDPKRIRHQVHLLYAILVGNLQLTVSRGMDERSGSSDLENAENDPNHQNSEEIQSDPSEHRSQRKPKYAPAWVDVNDLITRTIPQNPEDISMEKRVNTKIRLGTMLSCQASFGATIGAPVAFFLGSFLFTIFGNFSILGDNDNSHALAFGEWWMTIPHVAIVAGCLLAGNNPNTLEAIYSGVKDDPAAPPTVDEEKPSLWQLVKSAYSPFYRSEYQPVWMWDRGRSKRNWIKTVQKLYKTQSGEHGIDSERASRSRIRSIAKRAFAPVPTKDVPQMGIVSWMGMILTVSMLITVPWVLAYVTSFYTPTVGLSCRTFTFVMYFVFQTCLTFMWFIDFLSGSDRSLTGFRSWTTFLLTLFFFTGSAFTAIVGTFMQIVGVYRNCKCSIPMSAWGTGDFTYVVSSNSAQQIYYAQLYWLGTGVASMVLLILFCYLGWWYQRHWQTRFRKVVEDVLLIKKLPPPMGVTRLKNWVKLSTDDAEPASQPGVTVAGVGETEKAQSKVIPIGTNPDEIAPSATVPDEAATEKATSD